MHRNQGMKKKSGSIFLLLLMLMLGGCSDLSFLKTIPRDLSVLGSRLLESWEKTGKEEGEADRDPSDTGNPEGTRNPEEPRPPEEAWEAGQEKETEEEPEQAGFLYEGAFEYAAQYLSDAEMTWYQDMKQAMGSFGENVRLDGAALAAGCDEGDIDRIFQCVLNDHPELFYVEGYSYTRYTRGDKITSIVFSGTYSIDRETAESRLAQIEAAAGEILAGVEEGADQYTKVKYVYDTIIRRTDYDPAAPDNQNIYSVFVGNRSVCQGYAKAVQYLLNRLGVECTLVLGTVETGGAQGLPARQEGHAWNLVRVDGEYYYVDATWGDASYSRQDGEAAEDIKMPEVNYDYLNVTTGELLKTHTLAEDIPMPQCTATAANYYAREGALFSSYDRAQMQTLFDRAKAENRGDITVKCTDEACYDEVLRELVENHEIFRYLETSDAAVAYARNDDQMSLTFWVTNE